MLQDSLPMEVIGGHTQLNVLLYKMLQTSYLVFYTQSTFLEPYDKKKTLLKLLTRSLPGATLFEIPRSPIGFVRYFRIQDNGTIHEKKIKIFTRT